MEKNALLTTAKDIVLREKTVYIYRRAKRVGGRLRKTDLSRWRCKNISQDLSRQEDLPCGK